MKITRDLDANKEHTHNIGKNNRRDPSSGVRDLHALSPVPIQRQIHQHNSDAAEHEHEPRREPFDYVLPVDPAREEHDGSDRPGPGILGGADAGGLDDDVVDEAGYDHEVGEEDEGEDGHGGGEG